MTRNGFALPAVCAGSSHLRADASGFVRYSIETCIAPGSRSIDSFDPRIGSAGPSSWRAGRNRSGHNGINRRWLTCSIAIPFVSRISGAIGRAAFLSLDIEYGTTAKLMVIEVDGQVERDLLHADLVRIAERVRVGRRCRDGRPRSGSAALPQRRLVRTHRNQERTQNSSEDARCYCHQIVPIPVRFDDQMPDANMSDAKWGVGSGESASKDGQEEG